MQRVAASAYEALLGAAAPLARTLLHDLYEIVKSKLLGRKAARASHSSPVEP